MQNRLMQNNYRVQIAVKPSNQESVFDALSDFTQPLENTTSVVILGVVLFGSLVTLVFGGYRLRQTQNQLKTEKLRSNDLTKKLKLALNMIAEIERNPDLVNSREFNLDYLSMRMDEQVFRDVILAQININLKDKVKPALMPSSSEEREQGGVRKVEVTFDVSYKPDHQNDTRARVLFRIQVRLSKIPTQGTSNTLKDLSVALENFIVATDTNRNWTPTIQGRIANISWDQKAKPTPLLVIEQTNDGSNVSFRSKRIVETRG